MDWHQARRKLRLGPRPLTRWRGAPQVSKGANVNGWNGPERAPPEPPGNGRPHAASVCIASGKGGTGKSVVSASIASLFARRGRTLLVDADLGVGNAHILQDVSPDLTFVDVVEERCEVEDAVVRCSDRLDLLGAGSGYANMAALTPYQMYLIASGLERLERGYRYLLVDSAAGISDQTLTFAAACDVVVLVTTPDVTAMTDAYAFLKVLAQRRSGARPLLVVNRVFGGEDAASVAQRIASVSQKFLGSEPRSLGGLPEDRAAFRSVQRRQPVVEAEPDSDLARALQRVADDIEVEIAVVGSARGLGGVLVREVDYVASGA